MTMRLETTDDEKKLLGNALEEMVLHTRRWQLPILTEFSEDGIKSMWFAYDKRSLEHQHVDRAIEKMADTLRPVMKEFYEKMMDTVTDVVESGNRELLFVWYRMFDSFKYVANVTGRKRGADFKSTIDRRVAKAELIKRGLWKNK